MCSFGISKEQEKRCKTRFSPFGTMRSEGDIPSEHIGGRPWGPQRHSIAFPTNPGDPASRRDLMILASSWVP